MEASGWADSPQLSRLRSVAMTHQDCSAFSLVCSHAADFMREVSCLQSARPSGKMRCCCQISCRKSLWLHPKTEKCCLRRTPSKAGRHQGTSESKVIFTSCLMRYLHLIDFWRQHRCILHCLWYPTILCVPFRDSWAKKIKMASESCVWWMVCV